MAAAGKRHLLELRDYAKLLQGVKADRAGLELRRKITRAGLVAAGAIVVVSLLIGSALRVIAGLARGLALALDGRVWLADLVTGIALILALFGLAAILVWRKNKRELEEHVKKYEHLHNEQNARRACEDAQPLS